MRCRTVYSLHEIASQGQEDITRTMIEEKHPLNIKDRFGRTALHYCIESYRNCFDNQGARILACVNQLLVGGADPSIEDGQKRTVFDGAILQSVTFYNTESPNEGNLYYSPYGLDKHKASIKLGKLLQLLNNTELARKDRSWLFTYVRQQNLPINCIQILDDAFISSPQLLHIILLTTLMHGKGMLNSYLLTATKHGEKTALNLRSTEQVYNIASLLMHIYELICQINEIKQFLKFEDKSNPELDIRVCEHFEELSKEEISTSRYLKQIFKTLKEAIYTNTNFNYLSVLLSAGSYNYVRLADFKPNLFNYLRSKPGLQLQEHLIEVFVFIVDWIENRPEDRESGEELREEIVLEFNENCSLQYLIEKDLTGDSTYLNSASYFNTLKLKVKLVDFLINQALNAYGFHKTALHLAASECNIHMLQYLIYEKDVYLYAINSHSHTFYDILILRTLAQPETQEIGRSSLQTLINDLAPVMSLKPLKTICAEKIVSKPQLLNDARNKLGGCSKLMQLFRLHSSS